MALTLEPALLEREAPPGSLVDLVYRNEAGETSRRRVEIVRWSHAGNGFTYLRAFCFLREEERTFRTDRILGWRVAERAAPAPAMPVVAFVPVAPPKPADAAVPGPAAEQALRAGSALLPGWAAGATPSAHPAAPPRGLGGRAIWVSVAIAAGWAIYGLAHGGEPPTPRYVPAPVPPKPAVVPAPKPAPVPAPKPAPVPAPKPKPKPAPAPKPSLVPVPVEPKADAERWPVDDRAQAFRRATGIADSGLEALYRGADRDGDGTLEWSEIAAFQSRIARICAYRANATALRPDEFLAEGGGDCEDWALFACGLLRYWGWDPYVGSFAASERGTGHAVCLARVAERPSRFRAWLVEADGCLGGEPVKAGWYVPIDYEVVGGLSSAVEDGWRLRVIWTPEPLYGEPM